MLNGDLPFPLNLARANTYVIVKGKTVCLESISVPPRYVNLNKIQLLSSIRLVIYIYDALQSVQCTVYSVHSVCWTAVLSPCQQL